MIVMQNNRMLKILNNLDDKKFYYAALLFERFAEDVWVVEKNKYNVRHGYAHISEVIINVEKLLDHLDDKAILEKLGAEYIFILISSVYVHDVGMQKFYDQRLVHLKNKDSLNVYELEEIRTNHADIISEALTGLDTINDIKSFFGSVYNVVSNFLYNESFGINKVAQLILNYKRYIAVVSGFHNKPIVDLEYQLSRLCVAEKLCRDEINVDNFRLIAALLQVGDALDMSISRIDTTDFLSKVNSPSLKNEVSYPVYNTLMRRLSCYIIDDISIEQKEGTIDIVYNMSMPNVNITENLKFMVAAKNKYSDRLKRSDKDCLTVLELRLNKKINIYMDAERITQNNEKEPISHEYFKLQSKSQPNLEQIIVSRLEKLINQECPFLYVKFYSEIAQVFYGGIAFCNNHENKLAIEKSFFLTDDWEFDGNDACEYVSNLERFSSSKKLLVKYLDYLKICRDYQVESEIYFVINHGDKRIGYVNLHFTKKLNEKEIQEKCFKYRKEFSTLGFEVVQLHIDHHSKKYSNWIRSFKWLPIAMQNSLIDLQKNQYDQIPYSCFGDIKKFSVVELKEFFDVSSVSKYDKEYYVTVHKPLFEYIFNYIKDGFKELAEIKFKIDNKIEQSFVSIQMNIELRKEVIWQNNIEMAVAYIKLIDAVPSGSVPVKELEYLMPLKSMINIFGGKMYVDHDVNEEILRFEMLLPKRTSPSPTCQMKKG